MKILYVITGLGGGGAEKVVCDLADQMVFLGHEVKIAYLKGDVVVRPYQQEIELVYLGLESPFQFLSAAYKYNQLIKLFKPDIVHAHMVHANIFARLNRLFSKIPKLICTAHSNNEGGKIRMLAYQYTNRLSDVNTNVSKKATDDFIGKRAFDRDAITVYNGIELSKFSIINHKKNDDFTKIILAVGRLNIQKDYPNLLQAVSLIHTENKLDFKLLIAGEGEERENINCLIQQLNLGNHVELLGRRHDIPELMAKADIFVLSSAFEGFGLVVAEAMACQTFVVATDCGGVAEVMGDTGILVPPQDSKALAEAIKQAVSKTPLEIQENNLKARQRVEELFSLEKSVQNWLKLYEKS